MKLDQSFRHAAVTGLVFAAACEAGASTGTVLPPAPPPDPVAVSLLEVTPAQASLDVGQTQQLVAVARDAAGNVLARTISWSTSAAAIASVDPDGKVTANGAGQATITASSEGKSAAAVVTTAAPSAAGVVRGLVTDTRGRPIAGATVVINNALWFNRNIVLKSGTDGTYRYALPATDAWYVRGTAAVPYNGRIYTIELKPDYAAAFAGRDGHVVNLQWTMTGEVPKDFGHDGYYGGSVQMDAGWNLFDLKGVVLTLTPVGPLLDGSVGQVVTRTIVGTTGSYQLRDVPIGRYAIAATRDGVALKIRMRSAAGCVSAVTADFEPAYDGATGYGLYFAVATECED